MGAKSPVFTGIPLPLERFYHWEKNEPDTPCFHFRDKNGALVSLNWRSIALQVRIIARHLIDNGLKAGESVAVLSHHSPYWIMADLAIWMAGGVSVALYPDITPSAFSQAVNDHTLKTAFIGNVIHLRDVKNFQSPSLNVIHLPESGINTDLSWDMLISNGQPIIENPIRRHTDVATIIYSMRPKASQKIISHTFGSLAFSASETANLYEASNDDRVVCYLPLAHYYERMNSELMWLYQSVNLFFSDSVDDLREDMQAFKPTLFFAVPYYWRKMKLDSVKQFSDKKFAFLLSMPVVSHWFKVSIKAFFGLSEARLCFNSTAQLPAHLYYWFKRCGIEVLELYGQTETMGYSHSARPGRSRAGYVGQPNPMVEVKIGPESTVLLKTPALGDIKNLVDHGDSYCEETGYLNSKDIGQIESDGSLKVIGNPANLFKTSKGKRVSSAFVEAKLLESPHLEHCSIFGAGLPQPIALATLSAEVSVNEWGESDAYKNTLTQILKTHVLQVNERLDPHEKIKTLVIVRSSWTLENGLLSTLFSVRREAVEKKYEDQLDDWYETIEKIQYE